MILLNILVYITHQTLIYQFDASSNIIDGWEILNNENFINCGGIHYFGLNFNNNYLLTRIFQDLEPHSHIMVDAKVLSIDGNQSPNFQIDSQSINYVSEISSQNSICGETNPEYIHTISMTRQHNRRTVWIYIDSYDGGLISLSLSILKCQYECAECIDFYDTLCQQWKMHSYSFNQKSITNSEGWTFGSGYTYFGSYLCGSCQFLRYNEIKYFTQLPPHQNVLIRFYKTINVLIVDYLYGEQRITSSNQQIEILIRNHNDLILQLIIKTEQSQLFSSIRDFEVFYTQPENIFNNLNEGCLEYINDRCMICQEGWIQDELLENCYPICGDGIIQGQEECDDGNQLSNDSCHLCKYKCIDFCQICQFGICLECQDGFVINSSFNCDPLCGDGKLISYSAEQCELTVNGVQDGCQDCRFLSVENCKNNYLSICLKCEVGYQNQENICLPYCGDKIILEQYEDCDDGNEQPYDGCFQCKFQCIEDCNICDRGQCIFKCEHGYKFVNNNCRSVCGDKIVTKEEDCDDGNLQPQDGCFNCKYSCSENCYDCYQGTCLECKNQYQLLMSNQCMQQINCGDGLLQEQEECDDGNYQAVDGCLDCLIEENWICITMTIDSPSQCNFVKAPKLIINYLNMTQNKQYISISFDQRVKIQTTQPLSEKINLQLLNIEENKWNSSLYILQDVGSDVNFGEFIAQIEVYQLLEFRPVLKILINQTVSNIDNAVVKNVEKSILLQYPTYLDQTQKEYSKSLKNLNQNVIYSLSGITGFSLLIGELELFFEVLSILQFQQYLRYINLQFPENLVIYFSFNDMITVQPLLDFVQFPQLLQLIDIEQNEEYTHGKFRFYKQNTSLIINLQCQLLQLLMFLLFIFSFQWLKKLVYNQIFCSRYFNYMSLLSLHISPKIVIKLSQYFYNICINLLKLEKYNSFSGLQKALLINGWDMIFKTLLYLRHIETKNYIDIVQIIIVIIILILYFKIFLDCFKSKQKQSKNNLLQQFEIVSFVRQFFFLLFLIYVDNSEILQIELLLLTSLFQITLIYNYRFIFNKQNYIVQMVVEILVLLFIFSSFLYTQECLEYFNEEKKITLGWIQIILLSTGTMIELIVISYNLLKLLIQICSVQPQIVQQPSLLPNPLQLSQQQIVVLPLNPLLPTDPFKPSKQ